MIWIRGINATTKQTMIDDINNPDHPTRIIFSEAGILTLDLNPYQSCQRLCLVDFTDNVTFEQFRHQLQTFPLSPSRPRALTRQANPIYASCSLIGTHSPLHTLPYIYQLIRTEALEHSLKKHS